MSGVLRGYLELDTERAHHFQHGSKFRISPWRKCLVQTLSPEAGSVCDLRHAFGTGHNAKSVGDQRRLALLEHCFQIIGDVLTGLQMLRRIPTGSLGLDHGPRVRFGLGHCNLLKIARKGDRHCDVALLRSLVPARKKNDNCGPALDEIDAVAWSIVYSHFGDAAAHGLYIAGISDCQAIDAYLYTCPRSAVAQACEPARKLASLPHHRA